MPKNTTGKKRAYTSLKAQQRCSESLVRLVLMDGGYRPSFHSLGLEYHIISIAVLINHTIGQLLTWCVPVG